MVIIKSSRQYMLVLIQIHHRKHKYDRTWLILSRQSSRYERHVITTTIIKDILSRNNIFGALNLSSTSRKMIHKIRVIILLNQYFFFFEYITILKLFCILLKLYIIITIYNIIALTVIPPLNNRLHSIQQTFLSEHNQSNHLKINRYYLSNVFFVWTHLCLNSKMQPWLLVKWN